MKNPFGDMSNILKQAKAMQDQMAKIQEQAATNDALRKAKDLMEQDMKALTGGMKMPGLF